jgi:acetylornithine deacetylase/succinyl-diaminopimelate desuccinylase-like protein
MILLRIWLSLFFIPGPLFLYAQNIDREQLLQDISYLASEELEGRRPNTEGSLKARDFIRQRFDSLGLTSQFKDYTQFFSMANIGGEDSVGQGANILGFIPGEESAKLIVIMAHYDHLGKSGDKIYYGADDNASGTAGLLALASFFSENRPSYSMMFAAVDAEEMGLLGARALVKDFPFPLEDVLVNINLDMISRSEKMEIFAVGTTHYPKFKPILEKASRGHKVSLQFGHDEPGTASEDWTKASDHAAFHEQGVPFIYFGVEDHEDYHKSSDKFENIDQEFFYQAVNLILKCVRAIDEQM